MIYMFCYMIYILCLVGLSIFSMSEAGVEWATISAGTLMTTAPLFIAFLIFQRQFIASFMTAGIK